MDKTFINHLKNSLIVILGVYGDSYFKYLQEILATCSPEIFGAICLVFIFTFFYLYEK